MITEPNVKIYTFAEHCVRAGHRVSESTLGLSGRDSDDFICWEGPPADLLAHANECNNARSLYLRRLGRTISDELMEVPGI